LGVGIVDIVFDLNYCYRELLITEERERIKHFEITPPTLGKSRWFKLYAHFERRQQRVNFFDVRLCANGMQVNGVLRVL